MIVVPIIMDVQGKGREHYTLATLTITNDGTGTDTRRNYSVKALSKDMRVMREGRIENWPSKNRHVIDLVAAALDAVRK